MRYRLRTLLTLLLAGPPLIAWAWFNVEGLDEFVGFLTFLGILLLAYWSLGLTAEQYAQLLARAERAAARDKLRRDAKQANSGWHGRVARVDRSP